MKTEITHGPLSALCSRVPGSEIRTLLRQASSNLISLAGGHPRNELLPIEIANRGVAAALTTYGSRCLQYGQTEGEAELRRWICSYYAQKNIQVDPEEVLITTGSQQGIDLIARGLVNPGDPVLISDPGYVGAIQAFRAGGSRLVPWSADGLAHESADWPAESSAHGSAAGAGFPGKEQYPNTRTPKPSSQIDAKLLYTVPNFANPTGLSLTESQREHLGESHRWIVADDPYGLISFTGATHPWLPGLTVARSRIILLGSFSKWMGPGFRVGWIAAPRHIIEGLGRIKQASDLQTSVLSQLALYEMLNIISPEALAAQLIAPYREQRDAMIQALNTWCRPFGSFHTPEGGFFVWFKLKGDFNAQQIASRAVAQGVAVVTGKAFALDPSSPTASGYLRLSYSKEDPATIQEAVYRLSLAFTGG